MKKNSELKNLSVVDLKKKETELREELFNLKIQNLSGALEDSSKIKAARRQIARVHTYAKMNAQKQ